jgi:hypothetical protein
MRFHRPIVMFCVLATGCSLFVPLSPTASPPSPAGTAGKETPPASTASETRPATDAAAGWWRPPAAVTWQWQLSGGEIDTSFDVDVYDLDAFDASAEVVAFLHQQGRRVVCYISAGSWEDWRPDAGDFPDEAIGSDYEGWEGERWLDVRRIDRLAPVLAARMDLCQAKGFDGIEPDTTAFWPVKPTPADWRSV